MTEKTEAPRKKVDCKTQAECADPFTCEIKGKCIWGSRNPSSPTQNEQAQPKTQGLVDRETLERWRLALSQGDMSPRWEIESLLAAALQSAQPTAAVPEGYVMVPREPTEEMMGAGAEANVAHDKLLEWDGERRSHRIYKAMLLAARKEEA